MDELDRKALSLLRRAMHFTLSGCVWFFLWPVLVPYLVIRRMVRENRRRREEQDWEQRCEREREAKLRDREKAAEDGRRRTEARAKCELLFSIHAPEISRRFPRESMERFMQTYMGDTQRPEEVERRGRELENIIEQHRQSVKPDKQQRTIQDLAQWYLRERQSIESLPLDDEVRQEHLAALDSRYAELTQELLQRLEP